MIRFARAAACLAIIASLVAVTQPALAGARVSADAPAATQTATCQSSFSPAVPPPGAVATGLPGYRSAWYGQSGYARLCPHHQATFTIGLLNTGSLGWYGGVMGQSAYLGTWGPEPGQDSATVLGGDGTQGTPNTGWPRFDRIAAQAAPYVGPGEVGQFHFTLQAPKDPGWYRLHLRPLIEGVQWLDDQGIYWEVVVLNADGSVPPATERISSALGGTGATTAAAAYTSETPVTASWYGPGFYGRRTACGLTFSSTLQGVAHRTLACGTPVTLRHGGATVTVPVIDRGPFNYAREFDLSYATRLALGCGDICRLTWLR